MSPKVIDGLVNVHFGETEQQPTWMLKVRDDYFKGPESMFAPVDLHQLLDEMDAHGVQKAILMDNITKPHVTARSFAQARPDRFALAMGGLNLLRPMPTLRELTAVVAANDLLALGAYQELAGRGLLCPRDVSIVGHNDMPLVDMVAPPLTTVRIDHHTMGQEAARLVMARIEAELEQPLVRTTTVRLVVRASTAAPQPSRSVPFAGERP